jgi:hypothetical protein
MDAKYTVNLQGKTFVLFAGLLNEAHERGLRAVTTTLVQIPNELNGGVAIVHAAAEMPSGAFTGIGDASPSNVNPMVARHIIRMAETRAVARALRLATNIGMTSLEELGDLSQDAVDDRGVEFDADELPPPESPARQPRRLHPVGPVPSPSRSPVVPPIRQRGGEPRRIGEILRPSSDPVAGQAAATPKQLETVQRIARAAGKTIDTDGLTRAQASEIISSLINQMGERKAT